MRLAQLVQPALPVQPAQQKLQAQPAQRALWRRPAAARRVPSCFR
jgi:hypothetical protein